MLGVSLKRARNCTRFSLLVLPLIPSLGALGLLVASIAIWKRKYRQIVRNPLDRGFAVLAILLIINCCFAERPGEAFLGLANFLPFFFVFAALSDSIRTGSQLRQLAWMTVIPSGPIVILGLGQLWWGWTSQKVLFIFGWELIANGNPPGRMSSILMYANILALYLLIAFTLMLGLWIEACQDWRRGSKKYPGWIWLFLTVTLFADGIGLVLTSSRNAWGIAFSICLAFALFLGWRFLVLGFSTVAACILWASFGSAPTREWFRQIVPAYFWARLSDRLYPDRLEATLRITQWQFCWEMIRQRPWMGWGLRNFTPLYEARMGVWLGHPHNLFLMLMAEAGIPAALLFCGLVGWIIVRALSLLRVLSKRGDRGRSRLMLFTYLVAFGGCTLFNLLDTSIYDLRVNILGWVLLSAIGGVANREKNDRVELALA